MRFKGPDGKVYDRQDGTDGSVRFVDQRGNIYEGDSNELIDLRRSPQKTTTTTVPNEYPEWAEDKELYDNLIANYPGVSKEMYDIKIEQKNKK